MAGNIGKTGFGLIAAILLLAGAAANATEGAGSLYPVGAELGYGNMLPPGVYNLLYYNSYGADSVKGVSGGDNTAFREFRIKTSAFAYRFQRVWEKKLLGAGVESVVAVPYAFMDITRVTAAGADLGDIRNDFADALFIPARLGWSGKLLSHSLAVEFGLPLGAYDKKKTVNAGRNYWQYAPCYALSVRPLPGLEAHTKLRYAVNGENPATHYKSGDEFTVEFLAGYKIIPPTAAGIQGYYYRQTTDDELRGAATRSNLSPALGGLPNTGTGNRGRVAAIGPYISQAFSRAFRITLKYQREFGAENRASGGRFWLQALLPF